MRESQDAKIDKLMFEYDSFVTRHTLRECLAQYHIILNTIQPKSEEGNRGI